MSASFYFRSADGFGILFPELEFNGIATISDHPLIGQVVRGFINGDGRLPAVGRVGLIRRVRDGNTFKVIFDIERFAIPSSDDPYKFVSVDAFDAYVVCPQCWRGLWTTRSINGDLPVTACGYCARPHELPASDPEPEK